MAYVSCKLKSQVLQSTVEIQLYFPTDLPAAIGNKIKGVFTLLHGYTNSGDDWMQMSAAARYAADNGLALIMPSCGNSFYQNMVYGGAYFTFIVEEMPVLLNQIFHLPQLFVRAQNFIAGLSMGGYGALYIGLSRPQQYAGCASFSGAVDLAMMLANPEVPGVKEIFTPVFGNQLQLPQESDIRFLARKVSELPAQAQPKILLTAGWQDTEAYHIREQNDAMHETLKHLPLAYYKNFAWNGVHEWNFWDRSLVYAIDAFLSPGYAQKKCEDWCAQITQL